MAADSADVCISIPLSRELFAYLLRRLLYLKARTDDRVSVDVVELPFEILSEAFLEVVRLSQEFVSALAFVNLTFFRQRLCREPVFLFEIADLSLRDLLIATRHKDPVVVNPFRERV